MRCKVSISLRVLFGHIILFELTTTILSISSYNQSVKFQMITNSKSYGNFKKIINASNLQTKIDRHLDVPTGGQLCLESRVEEDEQCFLGLDSQNSRLDRGVKSSIDSDKKTRSNNISIPLSELILRDNGYDYMFTTAVEHKKLEKKYNNNLKEIKNQTIEMIQVINQQLVGIEIEETQEKIKILEKEIRGIRIQRKSRSPAQQYSQYLHCLGGRKERHSGKCLMSKQMRSSRSNMRTQCDSKGPSLSSTNLTPIAMRKAFLSPPKSSLADYHSLLKTKRSLIKTSIKTMQHYFTQRITQQKDEINIFKKQLMLAGSQLAVTPVRKNNYRLTVGGAEHSSKAKSQSRGSRRLLAYNSPRQGRKGEMVRMLSGARRGLAANSRQQYFISG